ncbi:MAG TPA: sn-glycerol-3-phosphate ABC transporter ATP-binding protein UgpC, partial [Steroidobacteraceae bacterium]
LASVTLKGVRKVYKNGHVGVDRADLEIRDGELIVLVGPSGCGKSTLLRVVAGLEEVTEGSVFIGDRDVTNLEPRDRDIAMVFQSYALYPHMTVKENLGFGLKLRGAPAKEIERRVLEAAEMLDLTSMLDRLPRQLSGGQRQRVALGRALVRHPQVFLLDEPLSNLDAKLRSTMRAEIARLHQRLETTMIYVTHDQIEAMTLGERVVVMDKGVLQQVDTPMNVYEHPANLFVAGFLGNPPMNMFRGRLVERNGLVLEGEGANLPLPKNAEPLLRAHRDREIVAGIRPEDFYRERTAPTDIEIEGIVELLESVGSESFMHFRFGSLPMIARIKPIRLPTIGARITLHAPENKILYFDGESGKAIAV